MPILVDLTCLHSYAFLVASLNKGGRALLTAWHAFRRDLVGEVVDLEAQGMPTAQHCAPITGFFAAYPLLVSYTPASPQTRCLVPL